MKKKDFRPAGILKLATGPEKMLIFGFGQHISSDALVKLSDSLHYSFTLFPSGYFGGLKQR